MSTVGKAVRLLEAFDIHKAELGLSELARDTGFDKATTYRLLVALTKSGLTERNPVTRMYRLGPAVLRLARIRETHFPLTESAKPLIDALSRETGETAHLTEYDAGALTSIYVAESDRANRISVSIGDRLPLHATASGLAYLAHAPRDFAETYLSNPLLSETLKTITDPEIIRVELERTRARGYSIGDQGREEGVFSVGAPILDGNGRAVGALAVAAPVSRITDDAIETIGGAVTRTADSISRQLFGRSTGGR